MLKEKKINISYRETISHKEELEKIAKENKTEISSVIRFAVKKFIE